MSYTFQIPYQTEYGQHLSIQTFMKGKKDKIYPLEYDAGAWKLNFTTPPKFDSYYYVLFDERNGQATKEWGARKFKAISTTKAVHIHDLWNKPNFPENYLLKPFFIERKKKYSSSQIPAKSTHVVSIVAALPENTTMVMSGNAEKLGRWDTTKAVTLKQTDYGNWEAALNLEKTSHTIQYKFGIKTEEGILLEEGDNRILKANNSQDLLEVYHENFYKYPNQSMPKKAGVAIPVFSLRTEESMGIGEFSDMKKFGDWMSEVDLSVLQILPINDTIANHNWNDCYPYAAISVYALNPFYISISNLGITLTATEKKQLQSESEELNKNEFVDLDKVMEHKWKWLRTLFGKHQESIFKNAEFKKFIHENAEWLNSYAVFCVLRDTYKTADFNQWKTLSVFNDKKVNDFFKSTHKQHNDAMFYAWIQYELDAQLTEAINYLHSKDIKIKGDLPIGIFRHSVEAWKEPELFGMDFQAGAPPDDFAVLGQNWEFPTYNWEQMQEDGLLWWKSRFRSLNKYFDAMRIDHILGFFRIWRIPKSATQGIMGYFYPAIPITEDELFSRGIHFSYERFCEPYINDTILYNQFGDKNIELSSVFMDSHNGGYSFKKTYNTQRKLSEYFKKDDTYKEFEPQLLYLLSNLILLTEKVGENRVYHPRFNFASTESYQHFTNDQKEKLMAMYNDYYFMRQDGMWQKAAMEKLPALLEATDMLICGEDLGLVPKSVPMVMNDLAILSLEVQRMTNDERRYSDPAHAPYLSVVTPGTHDTSTLRQWWQEDPDNTQYYYNHQLQRFGQAPHEMDEGLMNQIIEQHLYSPAMLVIIPIQEWMSLNNDTTHPDKDAERINIPAVFPHYWKYRMHVSVEELKAANELNGNIKSKIIQSGRG